MGQCQKVVEARFSGNLLRQEPQHVLVTRLFGKPGKKWIGLTGTSHLEFLEPSDEIVYAARHVSHKRADLLPHSLDIIAFGTHHSCVVIELLAPRIRR